MDVPLVALATGAAAWRDAHDDVRSGRLVVAQAQLDEAEAALHVHAAGLARAFARDHAHALELTPREATVLWRTYLRAYINGALDEARQQTGSHHPQLPHLPL